MSEPLGLTTAATELWRQDKAELATGLVEREHLIRRLQAEQGALLAEMEARGTLAEYGYGSLERLQGDLLHISKRDAGKRKERALATHPTPGIVGAEIPALAPGTGAAFAAGQIGTEHVDELIRVLARIPASIPEGERAGYEDTLVELARRSTPHAVRKAGRHLLDRVDPDGTPPKDDELAKPRRELLHQWRRNGRLAFKGELDAENGHAFLTALSPLSKPRPAENGQRDTRTVGQRNGDALADLIDLALRAGDLPAEGGERPQVVVTLDYDQLRKQARAHAHRNTDRSGAENEAAATLGDMPITVEQARRYACDADIIPAVLGSHGEVLDLGRKQRLASPAQRRALALRDKGCIMCGRPPKWSIAHHIIHWIDGGHTDLDNLCLLCTECHRIIHHSEWTIVMGDDGHPVLIPPPWMTAVA